MSMRQLLSGDTDLTLRGRSPLAALRLTEIRSEKTDSFVLRFIPFFGLGGGHRLNGLELDEAEPDRL